MGPQLLEGTTVNFPRSLVRLAWILQHAVTLLPMAGDIQAVINSQTAGVSDIHAWGLMLPSSSRVSPITYHSVVAVRYPDLCRFINSVWELGSFASGGLPSRPPGFQFVLWDTNARINGLVAVDLETLVSQVLSDYPPNAGFAFVPATDHKNNLNSSTLKKKYARTLRVETIANSAGGTAEVAIMAQPSTGFLNGRFYPDGSPTEDTEDCCKCNELLLGLYLTMSKEVHWSICDTNDEFSIPLIVDLPDRFCSNDGLAICANEVHPGPSLMYLSPANNLSFMLV